MFNSKLPTEINSGVTIISKGCSFHGKLFCRGISRIGGKIQGEIISEGTLIIEKDAVVIADIKSDLLVVQGRVTGKIDAETKMEIKATSEIVGEIYSPSIVVEVGSSINANVSMSKDRKITQDLSEQSSVATNTVSTKVDDADYPHQYIQDKSQVSSVQTGVITKQSDYSSSPIHQDSSNPPVDITKELNQRKAKSNSNNNKSRFST